MIKQKFIQEYSDLTANHRWRDLRSIFAIINDIGDRLSLVEQIIADDKTKASAGSAGNPGRTPRAPDNVSFDPS